MQYSTVNKPTSCMPLDGLEGLRCSTTQFELCYSRAWFVEAMGDLTFHCVRYCRRACLDPLTNSPVMKSAIVFACFVTYACAACTELNAIILQQQWGKCFGPRMKDKLDFGRTIVNR